MSDLECGHDLETGTVWCGECGTHRKLARQTAVAALLDAIDAIIDLPFPRSDIFDRAWECGCDDGHMEAVDAIRDLLAEITGRPAEDKSARAIWGDLDWDRGLPQGKP